MGKPKGYTLFEPFYPRVVRGLATHARHQQPVICTILRYTPPNSWPKAHVSHHAAPGVDELLHLGRQVYGDRHPHHLLHAAAHAPGGRGRRGLRRGRPKLPHRRALPPVAGQQPGAHGGLHLPAAGRRAARLRGLLIQVLLTCHNSIV